MTINEAHKQLSDLIEKLDKEGIAVWGWDTGEICMEDRRVDGGSADRFAYIKGTYKS
jgi:hypothetical protein